MIPFLRSPAELNIITQSKHREFKKLKNSHHGYIINEKKEIKTSKSNKRVTLPQFPKTARQKWVKSKEAVSRFFEEMDYNNEIQSTYDITLIDRQRNYDHHDVA